MIKYRPLLNASARINIKAMIKQATDTDDTVVALLEGEIVIVHPGQTDDRAIESEWRHAKDTREGWYTEMYKAQATLAAQMAALLDLDFSDLRAVIDWLEVVISIDRRFVLMPCDDIVRIFALYGFVEAAKLNDDEADRETAARYIIGQALRGRVHSVDRYMFSHLTQAWRERFEPVSSR